MSQTHVIGCIKLELQLPEAAGAFYIQEKMGSICRLDLPAALAPLFDQWSGKEELLCIDQLEIDLGTHSLDTLQQALPLLIKEFLVKHYPALKQGKTLPSGMHRIPAVQDHFETWLYFIAHGKLPIYSSVGDPITWETAVLEVLATHAQAPERCRQLFIANPTCLDRLTRQFDTAFIVHWLEAYHGNNSGPALLLAQQLMQCCYYPGFSAPVMYLPATAVFTRWLYRWLIKSIVVEGKIFNPVTWLEEILLHFIPANALPYFLHVMQMVNTAIAGKESILAVALQQLISRHPYFPKQVSDKPGEVPGNEIFPVNTQGRPTNKNTPEATTGAGFANEVILHDTAGDIASIVPPQKQEVPPGVIASSENPLAPVEEPAISDMAISKEYPISQDMGSIVEAIQQDNVTVASNDIIKDNQLTENTALPDSYIGNAGLIILHPFIPTLFEALGLIHNQAFCDIAARDKAIQLLGYLAGGQTALPEYDLILPKLLCGMLPVQVTDRFVELTPSEKAEADHLLAAVITHWSVLKNTSPDGLRANFLLRQGKLSWEQEGWRLRVSQEAYDMLLNSLPWGISLCRFSWMPWVIKTDWT